MATYKVPQDVEADDKLIGPFSFRQFIYLIIVVLAGVAAWGLAQLFIGLVIIPLPIIVFFAALALPLKKDQPMEIYLAAIVSYYIKPHKRLWDPEGVETLIEITAPKTYEDTRGRGLSQVEAEQRLTYLANIVDSGGWAIRGNNSGPTTSITNDVFLEAQGAVDVLDTTNTVGQSFDQMMAQTTIRAKEEAVERMKATTFAPSAPAAMPSVTAAVTTGAAMPEYNPYPTSIQQTVIQPLNDPSHVLEHDPVMAPVVQAPITPVNVATTASTPSVSTATPTPQPVTPQTATSPAQSSVTTSDTPVSADIINLANNIGNLSIATVAHEAHRVQKKHEQATDEVFVSLR